LKLNSTAETFKKKKKNNVFFLSHRQVKQGEEDEILLLNDSHAMNVRCCILTNRLHSRGG
jgi:hypothetical protein